MRIKGVVGWENSMKVHILKIVLLIWVFNMGFCMPGKAEAAEIIDFEEIKKGIVEIQSGFNDLDGTFCKVKSSSGFVLSNIEGRTYIVVGRNNTGIISSKTEQFSGSQEISIEDWASDSTIKIIVKDSTTVDAFVDIDTKDNDFAIVSVENVLEEKKSLKLRDDFVGRIGEKVYLLGFQQKKENRGDKSSDVKIYQGKIEDKDIAFHSNESFYFSAELPEDCIGGILVDEEGYVIGIRNDEILNTQNGCHAAIAIGNIINVLNDHSIYYNSALKDQKWKELKSLYHECVQMNDSENYKKESRQTMQIALEEVGMLESMTEVSIDSIQDTYELLRSAKEGMVKKYQKIQIIFWILGGIIVILTLWVIQLLISIYLDEKKEQEKKGVECRGDSVRQEISKAGRSSLDNQQEMNDQNAYNLYANQREENGSMDLRILEQKQKEILLSLIWKKNGQRFIVEQSRAVIGKGADTDIQITGNAAVSRRHAEILYMDERYWIMDLESLNGTFVNGRRLSPLEKQRISNGDMVILANETLLVELESY